MNPSGTDDEFGRTQRQINEKTNESLLSTQRMVGLTTETLDVAVNTMVALDEQGEKLNRIEEGLDNIHHGMRVAEKNLDQLNKCCGLCVLPWNRARKHRPLSNSNQSLSSDRPSPPITREPKLAMSHDGTDRSGAYIQKVTNDDRETEMEENLKIVSSHIGNLKNMAIDMGTTIDGQNRQLGRMAEKTESANTRIDSANKRTNELLRRA